MSMRILLVGSLTGLGLLLTPASVCPQATNDNPDSATVANITKTALAVRDSLEKTKSLRVGLSVGVRWVINKEDLGFRNATINPLDSTVVADSMDRHDVVLSGVVTAFPWREKLVAGGNGPRSTWCEIFCRLGFVANVTLAAFSPENVSVFNRSLEGGIGLAAQLSDDFALAMTFERVFSRRLRSYIVPGTTKLKVDGTIITTLDTDDDRFFRDDNLNAFSFKFIYFF